MDPVKLAKLQAAAAANRIGELFTVYTRSFIGFVVAHYKYTFFSLPFSETQVERELCAEKLCGKLSPQRLRTTKSFKGRSKN
jgi:hypothetical protein